VAGVVHHGEQVDLRVAMVAAAAQGLAVTATARRGRQGAGGGQHSRIDLVSLARQRARPLTFWASAIATSQPASSSWSWTTARCSSTRVAAWTRSPKAAVWRGQPA
jgi:hypothetical protein